MSKGLLAPLRSSLIVDTEQGETLEHFKRGHIAPQPWQLLAKCVELGTDVITRVDTIEDPEEKERAIAIARYVCNHICPVVNDCMQFAIENGLTGFRAGMTAEERAQFAQQQAIPRIVRLEEPARIIDLR